VAITRAVRGGAVLGITGAIDEHLDWRSFRAGVRGSLVVDLEEVSRITSFGVREWCQALQHVHAEYYCFVRCHPVVVSQFNLVRGFAGSGELVTLYVPYRCPHCNHHFELLLDLRQSYHQVEASDATAPCGRCGELAELDDLPELYFQYVRSVPPPRPSLLVSALIDGAPLARTPASIEKHIEDNVTAVWLHGYFDRSEYFRRLADGLQGTVLVILGTGVDLNQEGERGLVEFLRNAGSEVHLARVPLDILTRVEGCLRQGPEPTSPRLHVTSIVTSAPCATCHTLQPMEQAVDTGQMSDCAHCGAAQPHRPPEVPLLGAAPLAEVRAYLERYRGNAPVSSPPGDSGTPILDSSGAIKYQVVRRIGEGGMGEVLLARQVRPVGFERQVVLKRVKRVTDIDARSEARFLREAQITAHLSHPNIVDVYDLEHTGGHYVLAMEYVDGWDLRCILDRSQELGIRMPLPLCCRILIDVCSALEAAHHHVDERGRATPIVHRDVSPSNILVSRRGAVKLVDFGIAAVTGATTQSDDRRIKGKLRYIAPELAADTAEPVTPSMDVYAAAVILYECVAGRHLYQASSVAALLSAILHRPMPRLSTQRPEVPEALDEVFARGAARDVSRRYQSAREMRQALERVLTATGDNADGAALAAWVLGLDIPRLDRPLASRPPTGSETIRNVE
jgi:serine/threonine protein kinase